MDLLSKASCAMRAVHSWKTDIYQTVYTDVEEWPEIVVRPITLDNCKRVFNLALDGNILFALRADAKNRTDIELKLVVCLYRPDPNPKKHPRGWEWMITERCLFMHVRLPPGRIVKPFGEGIPLHFQCTPNCVGVSIIGLQADQLFDVLYLRGTMQSRDRLMQSTFYTYFSDHILLFAAKKYELLPGIRSIPDVLYWGTDDITEERKKTALRIIDRLCSRHILHWACKPDGAITRLASRRFQEALKIERDPHKR